MNIKLVYKNNGGGILNKYRLLKSGCVLQENFIFFIEESINCNEYYESIIIWGCLV